MEILMLFRCARRTLCRQLLAGRPCRLLCSGSLLRAQMPRKTSAGTTRAEARFVNDLLQKMTLEEKLGQMSQIRAELTRESVRLTSEF